jgi:phage/plasmid-associated DNA primase
MGESNGAATASAAKKATEAQLTSCLESLRVKKGEPFTHTTKSPAASYYIGEDDIETFTTIYSNAIGKGVRPTVTERPGPYGPLRFDFDLKSSLDDGLKRKYTDHILTSIIGFIQDEIKSAVSSEVPELDVLLSQRCVVLEKKAPRVEEGRIKDGFHLHFPNFVCEGWFQDEYLRAKITEKMITSKIWGTLTFLEGVDKFIDTGMAKKQWLMYGSAKAQGAEPFLVTRCYGPRDPDTGDLETVTVAEMFETEMEGRKSRPSYYLPRFLSIMGYLECTPLKPEIEARRSSHKTRKTKRGIMVRKRNIEDVMEDVKTIKEGDIMGMLSDDRAEDYNSWIDVGWTLFNVGQGCDEMLELWIEFSRRSAKFVEGDCEERWAKMEMRDKTIGSLFAMARSDSPDLYKTWKDMNINTHIEKSLYEAKPNEWDVAQVILKLYKDRFLCADAKGNVWYEFMGHKWQYMDDGVTMKKLFATDVVNLYYAYRETCATKKKNPATEAEREKEEIKDEKCKHIITALKECTFQKKLIEMCKVVFHDSLFLKRIDENKMIFACENGVLDFELMTFRDGRPDDYCTLSCNVIYPKNASHRDDECIEVEDYLKKVFPNPNLRQYFKDTASAALEGGNVNKNFIIGTGGGDNAKSVTYTFLEMTFGDYCIKFPRELFLVGKGNSSGGARPELARVRGKRLGIISEIAKTETLNIGILKELTGNDSFFARGIYEKGTDIKPMFTLFCQCNEPPKVPGHDEATWNRIKILDYESKFVKIADLNKYPVPETEEEQFKMKRFLADNTFTRKLPELCPYLLWMLFENYKIYKKNGLKEPMEVQMSTNSYRQQNDVYMQFIHDRIYQATEADMKADETKEKYFLKLADLYSEFTTWYHENNASYAREKFNKVTLQHEFNKKFPGAGLKKGRMQGWYGYTIIPDEDSTTFSGPTAAAKNAAAIKQMLAAKSKSKAKEKGKPESKTPVPGTKPITPRAAKTTEKTVVPTPGQVSKAKVVVPGRAKVVTVKPKLDGIPITLKTGMAKTPGIQGQVIIKPISKAKAVKAIAV